MEDMKSKAKKDALKKIKQMLRSKKSEGMEHAIAAKVVAKDPESLKDGLKKAAEIVESKKEMMHEAMESDEHEMMEDEYEDDYEEMSKEELIELLRKSK